MQLTLGSALAICVSCTLFGCAGRQTYESYVQGWLSRQPGVQRPYIEPDFKPTSMSVCRSPVQGGRLIQWDILVTFRNVGGDKGVGDVAQAPLDVEVHFDPNRQCGYDGSTGVPRRCGDSPDLLVDHPPQQWTSVPKGGGFGATSFSLLYTDGGPGYETRRVPTRFEVTLDQFRGNAPPGGAIAESNERNNSASVPITDYDTVNGYTGTLLRSCWYM